MKKYMCTGAEISFCSNNPVYLSKGRKRKVRNLVATVIKFDCPTMI